MKTRIHTFAFLAGAVIASASGAATIDVRFDDNIFAGSGSKNVDINGPGTGWMGVAAGRFQGTASNLVGVNPSIFVDGVNDLFMYCYDIYQSIGGGWTVKSYTINWNGEAARTLDFLGAVNQVINAGKKAYDPYAWLHPTSAAQGAAIQLGIWESKYENNKKWNLDDGSFKASNLSGDTERWWEQFRDVIASSDSLDGRYVMVLENGTYQDMIAGDPPAAVPEPGTLALLGLGLGSLAMYRRRRSGPAS